MRTLALAVTVSAVISVGCRDQQPVQPVIGHGRPAHPAERRRFERAAASARRPQSERRGRAAHALDGEAISEHQLEIRRNDRAPSRLAHVALEVSGRPLVVSNVDLSAAHVAGLQGDVVARFLQELAEGAGLTVHVRLIDGEDTQHVLETIFKSLGVALAQAGRQRG